MDPIRIKTFRNSTEVPCTACDGTGLRDAENEYDRRMCPVCGGSGIVRREAEGVIRLYRVE